MSPILRYQVVKEGTWLWHMHGQVLTSARQLRRARKQSWFPQAPTEALRCPVFAPPACQASGPPSLSDPLPLCLLQGLQDTNKNDIYAQHHLHIRC